MTLRNIGLGLILGVSLLTGSGRAIAQSQDFSKVEIKTIPVAEGIYMLQGEGGNIGVSVGDNGIFLVDDQYAPLTEKIRAAIASLSDQPVRFILNTHWHSDHTGGNENFGKSGSIIVAHDNVRKRMSTDQFIDAFQRNVPASPEAALPLVTFNGSTTFHLNGQTIQAQSLDPAHTDGDSFVQFQETNVIHTGDVYFNGVYPFIDSSSEGSIDGMITAAETILSRTNAETKIIPGHGPLSNQAELETYVKMLKTVRERTKAAIAQGTTLEKFIAAKPTADLDKAWGQGFLSPKQFLTIVYQQLSQP